MSNKFVISFKVSPNCIFIVLFSFFTVIFPSCQRLSYDWRPRRFVNMMTSYNRRKFYLINKHRIPNQVIARTSHNRKYLPRVISARVAFPLLSHNLCRLHCSYLQWIINSSEQSRSLATLNSFLHVSSCVQWSLCAKTWRLMLLSLMLAKRSILIQQNLNWKPYGLLLNAIVPIKQRRSST